MLLIMYCSSIYYFILLFKILLVKHNLWQNNIKELQMKKLDANNLDRNNQGVLSYIKEEDMPNFIKLLESNINKHNQARLIEKTHIMLPSVDSAGNSYGVFNAFSISGSDINDIDLSTMTIYDAYKIRKKRRLEEVEKDQTQADVDCNRAE